MLENKFKDMQEDALLNFLLVVIGGIALSTVIGSLLIQRIMNPINSMVKATENIASGDFKATVDPDRFPEEIATLGKAFNRMASAIEERDRQLRRQSQEEIRRSEKFAMIGRLAAGVAHEINNPLGSIMLFSRLLLRKAPSGGLQQENLKRIEKETRRCQVIVQGLLDFARRREPEFEDININDVVDKTIDLFANNPMLHNILIARETRPDLPRISVDPAQIMQVFTNILMNAVDGMDGRGTITIKTSFSASTKDIEVSFSDTGDGIADEMIEKIFEPFYTTKSVGQGTGLGLSVSLGIVEKHGGTIKVHSRLGEGATFVVVLPVCRESD
jgi:two-component system NtrC family sensor kinase